MKDTFDVNPPETNLETPTCLTCGEEVSGHFEIDDEGPYWSDGIDYDKLTYEHKLCEVDRLVGELSESDREDLVAIYKACQAIVNVLDLAKVRISSATNLHMLDLGELEDSATKILDELQAGRDYDPKWAETPSNKFPEFKLS